MKNLKTVKLSVRVTAEDAKRVREIVEKQGIGMNTIARIALREFLERREK